MAAPVQLLARTGNPDFLDLPWDEPLAEWESERLVEVMRGIHRHVVRFVNYEGRIYALKELPERLARREYSLLRALAEREMPVVEAVGIATRPRLEAVLVTRHLDYSLPYRALFQGERITNLRDKLLDAGVHLLARLHLAGFFWGDCSLSNALFRRDAGGLTAYLVDAETGELHQKLTDGQREHDVEIARENVYGELLDLAAAGTLPADVDPGEVMDEIGRRYEALWCELTREEVFGPGDRYRIDERLRRLNGLGYDVEEIELVADGGSYRLRLDPRVVEPGHHRRRLLMLTGLHAQENQARRMLNDLAQYRAAIEARDGSLPDPVAAYRWLSEVFEPAIAAVPPELYGKRQAAEIFHELLDHRWYLSEAAGHDVGLDEAVQSYVDDVLRHAPEERTVLAVDAPRDDES